VSASTTGGGAGQAVAKPRTDVDLAFAALLRWDLPLGRFLTTFAAVTLDVLPIRPEYTALVNGAHQPLLAPWPVRPGFLAGVAFAR